MTPFSPKPRIDFRSAAQRGGARRPLLALIAFAILAAVAGVWLAYAGPTSARGGVVRLLAGEGADGVAARLSEAGVLSSRRAFVVFARLSGEDRKLQAGRYLVPPGQSIRSLLTLLRSGPNLRERFTIPEGSRADEIAQLLTSEAGVDSAAFMRLVEEPASPDRFGVPGPTLEGYLFPDTYEIPWGVSAEEAVALFVEQYRDAMADFAGRSDSLKMTEREVITLASIIEAETGVPEERARVAAVFHNRLHAGWKLEADPTVRYATRNRDSSLTKADLETDSPYNTYVCLGLPPGPIGNPGRASIVAAMFPLAPSEEFFFVATGEGGHHFSRTIDEHNAAKARAKRTIANGGG